MNHALTTRSKWVSAPVVVVCGFISEETGDIYFAVETRKSFNGDDIGSFFDVVCQQYQPDAKLVFFGDGASINKSKEAKAAIAKPTVPGQQLEQLTNCPYRPDLMGVGKYFLPFISPSAFTRDLLAACQEDVPEPHLPAQGQPLAHKQ